MESSKITRAALGRFAKLGDLYDARREEFLSICGFRDSLTDDDIFEEEANSVEVDFIVTDSLKEKFDKLDINADLSLSILAGLVKLKGSASYLHDQKSSSRSARMTLTYSVRTKHQEVDGIKAKIDKDALDSDDATHIVVGIDWGAKCNVTCEYEKSDNEDETKVQGQLRAEIEKLKNGLSVEGGASVDFSQQGREEGTKFSYHSNCDVSDLSKDIPSTFEGAMTVATKLPSAVKKTNDGKGIPISYTMLSLATVRKMCKMEQRVDVLCKQIQEDAIKRCFQTMEKVSETRQKLNDLVKDLSDNQASVSRTDLNRAQDLQNNFEVSESQFKCKLLEALVEVRSGKKDVSALTEAQASFLNGKLSPGKVNQEISRFDEVIGKLKLIRNLQGNHVLYLGRNASYELALHQNFDKKVYILYMEYSYKSQKPDSWRKQIDLFFRLLTAHKDEKEYRFIAVDCEAQPGLNIKGTMYIEYFEKGILCCEDLYALEAQDLQNCSVKRDISDPFRRKPNDRVPLEIRCPKSIGGRCSSEPVSWVCWNCKDIIEYGLKDRYMYCKCGGGIYSGASFRCTDVKHGLSFVPFGKGLLEQVLNELRMVKETNIVILGETGVGKSTWINALANYLAFPTLNDAKEADDIKVLIPSQFSYTSETGVMQMIAVGEKSGNEVLKAGQSATQGPKAYKFNVGKHVIRLIDTPGIGDVRGLEQDEKNFENILAHLSYYEEIHGICILLKPNDSRLTVTFRFCITELLTHLHKSASSNIIFCFTNARSTFYRPGDTLPILQKLIAEYKDAVVSVTPRNQFCFDNEAFRFLACMKNGVQFTQQDIDTYSSSWDRAVSETERLFQHISELEPHSVQHTVSLNNARRIILELSKPLAETAANIQRNIEAADRKTKELQASNKTASELQGQLYLDGIDLEPVELDFPRTVCTDSSCVDYVQVAGNIQKTVYHQQCHPHCYLSGVPVESVNNTRLQDCAAMGGAPNYTCRKCNHSWKVHMHMTYDLEKKTVRVIDKNKNALLTKEQDHATKLRNFIDEVKAYSNELREEQKTITNICAQFGCYLKKNAITPFNDEIDAHLDMLIKQEQNKPDGSQETINNLQQMKQKYEQQKMIIYNAMEHPGAENVDFISDPGKVEELKQKLFKLKNNGATLKAIFAKIQKVRSEYHYNEMQVAPIRVKRGRGLKAGLLNGLQSVFRKVKSLGSTASKSHSADEWTMI